MNATYLLAFGYLASVLTYVPWPLIFLVTQLYGVRLYTLKNREDCKRIQKRVGNFSTHTADNNTGYGYAMGFWYFVSISILTTDSGEQYTVWLIATAASYDYLIKDKQADQSLLDQTEQPLKKTEITFHDRQGSFYNNWFKRRIVSIKSMAPRANQQPIIDKIMEHQAVHQHTVVYLHGEPGKGKSIIGILLANAYKSSYCNSLKPWLPGDSISSLWSDVEPTAQSPLILVFEEFDGPLGMIHQGIPSHAKIPIMLQNKTGWNKMLDEIHIGMYPHMILLLTSNKSPEFIRELDPSYIREGRVDLTFCV